LVKIVSRVKRPINAAETDEKKALTIALLTTGAIDPNNRAIWAGADMAARDSGVNLICYPGRLVHSPVEFESQRNVIYRMVDAQTVDGLVVMGGLNAWVEQDETYSFLQTFHPRPIVTTGIVLEGFPGVTVDNYHGMYEVITHLVTVHDRRRIAFIRGQAGHQEAIDRYQAYLDVLAGHNIPFDPELVYQGNFKESGGVQGANALLDERKVQFDALVAASDNMAIGAMKTFQARGLRVPADVAVAGLNDEEQGLVINPPLTTAPLHFYEQAYQATLMVLSLLDGKEVPPKVILPTRMVVRQSCGCPDPLVTHAEAIPHTEKLDSFTDEIRLLDTLIFGEADPQLQIPADEPVRRVFPVLLKSFLDESRGKSEDEFLRLFVETIQKTAHTNDAFPRWHEIISILRQFAISQLTDAKSRLRIENLVQQARVVIGESARRHYAYQVLQADEKLHSLGEINQSLSVVTSIAELTDVLERSLSLLNIPRCYLFMYEDPLNPDDLARFIFSYEDHHRVFFDPQGQVFPARQLLPGNLLTAARHHSLVVEPLFFRDDQLGYAIFEADPQEEAIYEILGGQISASLKRTILTERNIRLFDEAVEARKTAEQANLLKSRFLSMVSHELRTPLALIVGTIEMMLQEEKSGSGPPLPESYRRDMDGIHASSKHLFRLIGDVLDLASNQAGELRLVSEPLDLSTLFAEAAVLGKSMAREKGLEWREQIPLRLPLVMGDRTRLRQVTLNLLSNAIKFTERGHVSMTVRTNEEQVLVEINDTGMGIPVDEQEVIFDEFRRSERSVARGYGGMGLGLAITRRLIELHGGRIGVRSAGQEETGSTFYFSLPVIHSAPAGVEMSRDRQNTVLLLSEDPATRLKQHLQQKGFEVEVIDVSQQPDWLTHIISQPPGAVVLDYQPATERGWELMRLLKQNPETSDVPIVFYNLSAGLAQGSMLEMDYLSKPVASTELLQALERVGLKCEKGRRTILVVDDDPNMLDMHVRMLESQVSCRILKARNGREALEIMQQESPSLVLLDLMMPEVDGFEVLRVMREQEGTRNVPVIVLSAQILTAQDMLRLQEDVAAVLGKGLFSVEEVLAQVETALSHSKRLGSQASRTVRQAMAYIHEHYGEPVSRADLASHVAITERYLTRCFRQEMGITPMIYLNRYRVKRAKILLKQGKLSITEVAMAVGFSDSSYFNRVFRQEVGVAPGAYQRGERIVQ
jgi:signal transduction histidine kinase/DNA-binding LacI/PurR family transcriptional regulator/AraC-like DNA-binding protein/response regulator of citrate/malate metabolism